MAEINGIQVPFTPIIPERESRSSRVPEVKNSFEAIFSKELEEIKFSNHAQNRLESRNISFSNADLEKLQSAVERAENKGARDSLIMLNDTALIVNIPNRTVVTAMPVENEGDNIFTNIDSVVFT